MAGQSECNAGEVDRCLPVCHWVVFCHRVLLNLVLSCVAKFSEGSAKTAFVLWMEECAIVPVIVYTVSAEEGLRCPDTSLRMNLNRDLGKAQAIDFDEQILEWLPEIKKNSTAMQVTCATAHISQACDICSQ